jgi:hypothetical protein
MRCRAFAVAVFTLFLFASAVAVPPKRTHYEEPSVDSEGYLEFSDSPRPQPEVTVDPILSARELACQPLIIRSFIQAWRATLNGTRNQGLAEAGFAIESYKSSISIQGWRDATVNRLSIPEDEYTIAIAHVHGRGADEHPAAMDMRSPVANFVISGSALYVTSPGTTRMVRVRDGVGGADGWNKPCVEASYIAAQP